MKKLKKFNNFGSLFESFKLDNEDIEDLFIDYVDNKQFRLVEGFVCSDNRFFTDVASVKKDTKKCKEITINLKGVADGIQPHSGGGRCLTDIKVLSQILSEIEQFYHRSGESPNFQVKPSWEDLEIKFYIVGGLVESSEFDLKEQIENFLKELEIILKTKYNYKRLNLKRSNWLEIRTPVKGGGLYGNAGYALNQKIRRSFNNQLDATRDADLIQWATRVTQGGFRCELTGGDNQVVVQLKKI
jgi:hypothetical protein